MTTTHSDFLCRQLRIAALVDIFSTKNPFIYSQKKACAESVWATRAIIKSLSLLHLQSLVVMMHVLSSVVAPAVVVMTTTGAASGGKFVIMTTLRFQCMPFDMIEENSFTISYIQ